MSICTAIMKRPEKYPGGYPWRSGRRISRTIAGACGSCEASRPVVRADYPAFTLQSGDLPHVLSGEFQADARAHTVRLFDDHDAEVIQAPLDGLDLRLLAYPGAAGVLETCQGVDRKAAGRGKVGCTDARQGTPGSKLASAYLVGSP